MGAPCGDHCESFDGSSTTYKRALIAVIAINGIMFVVEMAAGFASHSTALRADALDFFGDTLTYALSLAVIGMALKTRAKVALLKGFSLLAMGLFVASMALWQMMHPSLPAAPMMGAIGLLALVANLISVALLLKFKDGDANVRSVWLCSRNDAIGNVAVMGAAMLVALTHSQWPDLIVALAMSGLFLSSAWQIITRARAEMHYSSTA